MGQRYGRKTSRKMKVRNSVIENLSKHVHFSIYSKFLLIKNYEEKKRRKKGKQFEIHWSNADSLLIIQCDYSIEYGAMETVVSL